MRRSAGTTIVGANLRDPRTGKSPKHVSMSSANGPSSMFPFTDIARANDQSAKLLASLAQSLGSEGSDWVWEWRDGGRVAFSFRNLTHRETFHTMRLVCEG
jgi:hypothetical protein